MSRFLVRSLAVTLFVGTAVGCSQYYQGGVGVTKSESVVAGCQKIGEVAASAGTPDKEVPTALSNEARSKGANYVLVQADGARSGSAYRCGTPSVAAR